MDLRTSARTSSGCVRRALTVGGADEAGGAGNDMRQTTAGLLRAPTDLSNFLSCRHLSALDLRAARGEIERPVRRDVFIEDLRARGLAHERAYLDHLRAQGLTVAGADDGGGAGTMPDRRS